MMKEYWNRFLHWCGWKKIFPFPAWATMILFAVCCTGLVWVFINGQELWWPSYILYGLSAYCLAALCIKLPAAVRAEKLWMNNHPQVEALLKNKELHFKLGLYFEQFLNFAYGIFKIVSGVIIGSAWIGADGIYNFTQALIQLFQILRRKKPGTMQQQWKSYRFCGFLILLMHLTITGIVFQMVNWNRADNSGEIMIIATATFAFYKFISSFIDLAKDRKHTHPIDSSVRMLELSQAIFAIFSLQAGMLHTFGTGENWEHPLNLAVGCMVCLLTVAMGIYMIRRANREMKQLQEKQNGESLF
ncbi:MAG: hypothetical protein IIW56_08485 [Oscillospiraceae bacterium]|nr:hypothetical protein [Oscillospiraceae bacterium]